MDASKSQPRRAKRSPRSSVQYRKAVLENRILNNPTKKDLRFLKSTNEKFRMRLTPAGSAEVLGTRATW